MIDLDELASQAQRRYEQFRDAQRRLDALVVTETSADGLVRASVLGTGALVDLSLAATTRSMPPSRVAAEVLGCVQRAQAAIAERMHQLLRETVTGDDPIIDELVAEAGARFPQVAARNPAPVPARRTEPVLGIGRLEEED